MLMALVLPVSALVVDFKQCANDDNPLHQENVIG